MGICVQGLWRRWLAETCAIKGAVLVGVAALLRQHCTSPSVTLGPGHLNYETAFPAKSGTWALSPKPSTSYLTNPLRVDKLPSQSL